MSTNMDRAGRGADGAKMAAKMAADVEVSGVQDGADEGPLPRWRVHGVEGELSAELSTDGWVLASPCTRSIT